jgi:mannan endo-1,4-beta-mannosidase
MTFQFDVASYAPCSSVVPRATLRSAQSALTCALALLAAALPGCARAEPIASDDLVLTPADGQALTQTPAQAAVAGLSTTAAQPAAPAARANGMQANDDGRGTTMLALEDGARGATTPAESMADEAATDEAAADEALPPVAPGEPLPAQPPPTSSSAPAPVAAATMRTSGRQLLDSCGNVFVVRGVEQIFGNQLPEGNDWLGLLNQIAATGVNAVRILAGTDTLAADDVDALLNAVAAQNMVAYNAPYGSEGGAWLAHPEVKTMLAKHERHILIDAFGEPTFDDRARFVSEATASLQNLRNLGYRVPLTVTGNQFGRDLPSILELGPQILAADPLHNTVFGWQAYWSSNGFYQNTYGYSLEEAVAAAAAAPFPIQLGLDRVTDFPSSVTADFGTLMSATQANGIGWLWWDWYNPYGNENSLTEDGTATRLTPTGRTVMSAHPASVQNTAQRACAPR